MSLTDGNERPGLAPGLRAEVRHTVTPADCADSIASGSVRVLSTPHLIALLEQAALTAVAPHLAPGETSVGTRVEVEHLDACPPGVEVVSEAELLRVEGRRLRFAVAVRAGEIVLGRGAHERVIVNRERFLSRLTERWRG